MNFEDNLKKIEEKFNTDLSVIGDRKITFLFWQVTAVIVIITLFYWVISMNKEVDYLHGKVFEMNEKIELIQAKLNAYE